MNENQLKQSFDTIKPTQEQKDRMHSKLLSQIEKHGQTQKTDTPKAKVVSLESRRRQWTLAAASLVAVVGLSVSMQMINTTTEPTNTGITISAPSSTQGMGMRKFMNYNGHRYVFLEDTYQVDIEEDDLIQALDTLETQLTYDGTSDPTEQLATSFAIGGTIWEVEQYNPSYRVVVALEGNYYLCENMGRSDDQVFNLSQFFDEAKFSDRVEHIEMAYRNDNEQIARLNKADSVFLLELISESEFLMPSEIDFETFFSEEPIRVKVVLDDQTRLEMVIVLSQNIIGIGDNYYSMTPELEAYIKDTI